MRTSFSRYKYFRFSSLSRGSWFVFGILGLSGVLFEFVSLGVSYFVFYRVAFYLCVDYLCKVLHELLLIVSFMVVVSVFRCFSEKVSDFILWDLYRFLFIWILWDKVGGFRSFC